jgi:hypothetical protein
MDAAERHHTRNVAKYVIFGGIDGRNALYTAAEFGAQGAQAGTSLGIVNVIGIATRAWHAWRNDPVSNQEVIDRGEELLARNPEGAEAKEVHARLATTYERAGNYERALMYRRAAGDPTRSGSRSCRGLADVCRRRRGSTAALPSSPPSPAISKEPARRKRRRSS